MTSSGRTYSTRDRLSALTRFLPIFDAPGFQFSEWIPNEEEDGSIVIRGHSLGEDALRLNKTVYEFGWIQVFDWREWAQSPEADALTNDPAVLARATVQQLERLITTRFRADRFMIGSLLAQDYERGLLRRIVARASALLDETPE